MHERCQPPPRLTSSNLGNPPRTGPMSRSGPERPARRPGPDVQQHVRVHHPVRLTARRLHARNARRWPPAMQVILDVGNVAWAITAVLSLAGLLLGGLWRFGKWVVDRLDERMAVRDDA